MSRIGKQIIKIPNGVEVSLKEGKIFVAGSHGKLERDLHDLVTINIADNQITVDVADKENKFQRSLWGTFAAHIKNMIKGVTVGFKRQLEINGVGYKVALQGTDLKLDVGYSNPVIYKMPEGVKASVEKNVITVEGASTELLGKVASEIRAVRKPEPYKGKGIKYVEETIRRKAGKAAKSAA